MKLPVVACALACASYAGLALADTAADDAIKYRKALMNSVKSSVDALIAVTKGEVEQADRLPQLAASFAASSQAAMTIGAFEQNTHGDGREKTTATEKVWEQWQDFSEAFSKLESAANEIQALADAGELTSFDQIKPALAQCGYCHREAGYRVKQ